MRESKYIELKDLPSVLHHFKKTSVSVTITDELVEVAAGCYGDGYRNSIYIFNLETGSSVVKQGGWGGASMFSKPDSIDLVPVQYEIDKNTMIAVVQQGGTNAHKYGSVTKVYIHPDRINVKDDVELTDDELKMMLVFNSTSSYRPGMMTRYKLGKMDADNPLVVSLIAKKLVKKAGAGYSMTAEGRNAMNQNNNRINNIESVLYKQGVL
jgi:hypothetical protein